jgi:hypothetical protein
MLVLLKEGIYELCCFDGLRCHDIRTKLHKDYFRHSEIVKGGEDTRTGAQTATLSHKLTFIP